MSRKDIYVQDVEDARDGYLNTSAAERARERNGYGSGLRGDGGRVLGLRNTSRVLR
jgi:hypothetical protein